MKSLPLVSIIIPTKNEEKNINRCLESIKQQTYPNKKIEIIVIDNNSIDQTKKIARKYTKNVFNYGLERSAQRNLGMKKAKGKYLMFLDADMRLASGLIKKAVLKMEIDSSLAGLYIPEIIPGNSFWNRLRNFERSFYNASAIDCVRIIKQSVFKKTGGFDKNLTGPEDWDFDKKIRQIGKVKLLQAKKAVIYHQEDFNLLKYLKKKSYYSKSFNRYIKKWGQNDPDIKKQFNPFYRGLGIFIEKGKWKKSVTHPFLILAILSIRFLVGLSWLKQTYLKKK